MEEDPKKNKKKDDDGWHSDEIEDDDKGISDFDILEEIFLDEDGEIRWVTLVVILICIAILVDWSRGWAWVNGIKQVVTYIDQDMADPNSLLVLLS